MNGRKGFFIFGAGLLASAGMLAAAASGCQSNDTSSTLGSGGTNNGGSNATSNGGTNNAGGNGTGAGVSTSSNNGGSTSASTGSGAKCTADMTATITDVSKGEIDGSIPDKVHIQINGAVVMSQKFLASSSGGSCLWGVFLSEPGITTTAPNSGILALSYGNPAVTSDAGTFCPTLGIDPAGDSFPDTIKPGDVVTVIGESSFYAPMTGTNCDVRPVQQVELNAVCSVKVNGTAKVPTPATTGFSASDLAGSGKKGVNDVWSSVKVELQNVTAAAPSCTCTTPPTGCPATTVGCYGDINLDNGQSKTTLEVADKVYYAPHTHLACHQGPNFGVAGATFESISGFVSLDYCTWAIFPNSQCSDISPMAPAANDNCGPSPLCTE